MLDQGISGMGRGQRTFGVSNAQTDIAAYNATDHFCQPEHTKRLGRGIEGHDGDFRNVGT